MTVKVLVVDDSAVVRLTLSNALSREPGIEVVSTAPDPFVARDKIVELEPDVVTLDVEMPGMNGITFLRKVMHYHPIPVIVVSSHTPDGSKLAFEALEAGAMEIVCKPGPGYPLADMSCYLAEKIREVARIKLPTGGTLAPAAGYTPRVAPLRYSRPDRVIAIGASIGGPRAIEQLLRAFPANAPGTVVVQHMPAHFTKSFADRLDGRCAIRVVEAEDEMRIETGTALIAPGNRHMLLQGKAPELYVNIKDGPRIQQQRPSIEILFKSVARVVGNKALGVLLTGMGSDGARGLLEMKQSGAYTVVQDQKTCAVYGMPAEAVKCDAACAVLPLDRIAAALMTRADQD
jgi:two-component system chemotaxis response regulator CheB